METTNPHSHRKSSHEPQGCLAIQQLNYASKSRNNKKISNNHTTYKTKKDDNDSQQILPPVIPPRCGRLGKEQQQQLLQQNLKEQQIQQQRQQEEERRRRVRRRQQQNEEKLLPDDRLFVNQQQQVVHYPTPYCRRIRGGVDESGGEEEDTKQPLRPRRYTCGCCYDDLSNSYRNGYVVKCSSQKQHLFCIKCVRTYVGEFVFGGACYRLREFNTINNRMHSEKANKANNKKPWMKKQHDEDQQSMRNQEQRQRTLLPCLSGDCADGCLEDEQLQLALSARLFEQYQQTLQQKWDFLSSQQGAGNNIDAKTGATTPTTVPLTPEQTTKEEEINNGYRELEEALTLAKVRECSTCLQKFIKDSDFCNKLCCPTCRTTICYVCRKANVDYDHFCSHQEGTSCTMCRPDKCPLWTNDDDERDEARLRELGMDMANRIWEKSLLKGGSGGATTTTPTTRTTLTTTEGESEFSSHRFLPDTPPAMDQSYEIRLDIERLLQGPNSWKEA